MKVLNKWAYFLLLSISQSLVAEDLVDTESFTERLMLGGSFVTWNYENGGQELSPISFEAMADLRLFEPLEASLRLGMGFGEDESTVSGQKETAALEFYKIFYFKPYLSWDNTRLYGLFGYANYDLDVSDNNVGKSGPSYGIGADYYLYDAAKAFFEWRHLPKAGGSELVSVALGFTLPY